MNALLDHLRNMKLGTRILALAVTSMLLLICVNYVVFVKNFKAEALQAMVDRAGAFTAVADEAKNHTGLLAKTGAFDTKGMLEELAEQQRSNPDFHYAESRIFNAIPVVAGWKAAEHAATREGINFRISSFEARNPKNEPEKGSFSEGLLTELTAMQKTGGGEIIHAVNRETNSLHYLRAITLTEDCMMCHGQPGNRWDTDGDGKDPVGFAMEGWKPGYMHGAYEVIVPLEVMDASVASFIASGAMWSAPIGIGACLIFAFVMKRIFGRPMKEITARMKDVADGEGDLTLRMRARHTDELGVLGKWFNLFMERMNSTILEVNQASLDVAAASTEIAAASEQMAQGMGEQTNQINQISAAIEEMSASVSEVASKSSEAARSAEESGQLAGRGGEVVGQTVKGMTAINEAVASGAESVTELGKRSEQIGEIVSVITDIADQTNLLALNAAIEAARAGEHGRGFAVVADEVRKLADRTTKATDEIISSIRAIREDTEQAITRMNSGTEQVNQGVSYANEAGQSLGQIVRSAQSVAALINSIAAATEEQSSVANEISLNTESITRTIAETNSGAEQAALAANELSQKAEQLRVLVGGFKTTPLGAKSDDEKPVSRIARV